MTNQFNFACIEGQSTNRPPLFNIENYNYWKTRMKIFIRALDYNLWSIIVNGPHIFTHSLNNLVTLKPENEWDDNDRRMA